MVSFLILKSKVDFTNPNSFSNIGISGISQGMVGMVANSKGIPVQIRTQKIWRSRMASFLMQKFSVVGVVADYLASYHLSFPFLGLYNLVYPINLEDMPQ